MLVITIILTLYFNLVIFLILKDNTTMFMLKQYFKNRMIIIMNLNVLVIYIIIKAVIYSLTIL